MSKSNSEKIIVQQDEKKSLATHRSKRPIQADKSTSHFSIMSFLTGSIFLGLFFVSIWFLFKYSKYSTDAIIAQDMQTLQQIFREIDKDCKIIDFEHTKNYIDFLTVKEFIGSQVGAMNITYPKNWKGPYLKHNPTVLEQQYIVLKSKKSYYLVPGDGVILANGQTIGTDIILNEKADIEALLQDPKGLKSSQGPLAVKIEIGGTYFKKVLQAPVSYATLEG